jgi:hypothetical protein
VVCGSGPCGGGDCGGGDCGGGGAESGGRVGGGGPSGGLGGGPSGGLGGPSVNARHSQRWLWRLDRGGSLHCRPLTERSVLSVGGGLLLRGSCDRYHHGRGRLLETREPAIGNCSARRHCLRIGQGVRGGRCVLDGIDHANTIERSAAARTGDRRPSAGSLRDASPSSRRCSRSRLK